MIKLCNFYICNVIKYDSSDSPVFGMRFIYRPDKGKLV